MKKKGPQCNKSSLFPDKLRQGACARNKRKNKSELEEAEVKISHRNDLFYMKM